MATTRLRPIPAPADPPLEPEEDFEEEGPAIADHDEPPPVPVRRWTVEEYHRLIDCGFFAEDERFELLEGWIVPKMTRNPPHEVGLDLATDALKAAIPAGWRVRVQSSITAARSEPEPDLCVVRGSARDYLNRHPVAADIALVVEVADSSVSRDRGLKGRLYARMRIPRYWIVNLVDRCVEVYSDPSGPGARPAFRRREIVPADGSLSFAADGVEVGPIAARDLLP